MGSKREVGRCDWDRRMGGLELSPADSDIEKTCYTYTHYSPFFPPSILQEVPPCLFFLCACALCVCLYFSSLHHEPVQLYPVTYTHRRTSLLLFIGRSQRIGSTWYFNHFVLCVMSVYVIQLDDLSPLTLPSHSVTLKSTADMGPACRSSSAWRKCLCEKESRNVFELTVCEVDSQVIE